MSRRTERVASTIQQELAIIILRELNDPRITGMPSITRVKVADDLSIADVYLTIMGTPGAQNAALNAIKHSAGLMRVRLTEQMRLRQAPFLRFHIDEKLKKEIEMQELLAKVAAENAEIDRLRAEQGVSSGEGAAGEVESPSGAPAASEPAPAGSTSHDLTRKE